ncbi:hypothetical protein [Streptomyces sp. NPDC050856]|uniref:hypothetical protein n=1 Tax=Streptomyces sp. NPDC050856 TaxID=3154939 RepID=UPI0033FBE6D8
MNAMQQHMIDTYRAAQHGEPAPPPPGRDDWAVLRAARERRRFTAVLAGRPARHGRLRRLWSHGLLGTARR